MYIPKYYCIAFCILNEFLTADQCYWLTYFTTLPYFV